MENNTGLPWECFYPSSPNITAGPSSSSSNYSGSPSSATSTPASSPSSVTSHTALPTSEPALTNLAIDYNALIMERIPALDFAFYNNPAVRQTLQEIINSVAQGILPADRLLNNLIFHDGTQFRCSVGTCDRHQPGRGWSRLDRARDHFRSEHLGAYYPCSTYGCSATFRRPHDFRDHVRKRHEGYASRHVCGYCDRTYPTRNNLNRHIEQVHGRPTDRRMRRGGT